MKKAYSKIPDSLGSFYNDCRNTSHYNILNYENFEPQSIPYNPNTLSFTDRLLNIKLTKLLYCDQEQPHKPSKEFKANLMIFFIFLNLFLAIMIAFSIMMKFSNRISEAVMNFHITFSLLIGFFSYLLLIGIFKVEFILLNNKYFFFCLILTIFIYLILGDESVISTAFGESTGIRLPTSIGIICFTIFARIILFDCYLLFTLLCLFVLIFYICINLGCSSYYTYSILAEFSAIGLFMILQIIETQQIDIRTRQLF